MAPYAFAENETSGSNVYNIDDTFEADSSDAQLPDNIAENTKWSGPERKLVCGVTGDWAWTDSWSEISEREYYKLGNVYNGHKKTADKYYYGWGYGKTEYTGDLYKKVRKNDHNRPGYGGHDPKPGDWDRQYVITDRYEQGNTYGLVDGRYVELSKETRYYKQNWDWHSHTDSCYKWVWTLVADQKPSETGDWTYAYYLGQEYFENSKENGKYNDPLKYGIQDHITSITVLDDKDKEWTFKWNTTSNGEWRIEGSNVSEAEAKDIPVFTDGGRYTGTCGNDTYKFTLTKEDAWNHIGKDGKHHVNVFYYIRFIADYTVNVYTECDADTLGKVGKDGKYYTCETIPGEFTFQYPPSIRDSEKIDPNYTAPVTLRAQDYVRDMLPAYELNKATDSNGNDVMNTGVTVGLFKDNELNVYCTRKASYSEQVTYDVEKKWNGNTPEGVTVTAGLYNGETQVKEVELNADNNWSAAFASVPKYDGRGKAINYTIKEVGENGGKITIDGKEYTVTYTQPKAGTTEGISALTKVNGNALNVEKVSNLVIIKKPHGNENAFKVWINGTPTEGQKAAISESIRTLEGYNKNSSIAYVTELSAINAKEQEGRIVNTDNSKDSLYWTGTLTYSTPQVNAVITNTYIEPSEVTGSFTVQKVDKEGNAIGDADTTKNAVFELYKADKDGNIENDGLKDKVVAWKTVDENGCATFDDLPVGRCRCYC